MKLGAEPKKLVLLAVLLVVAAGSYFYNSQSDAAARQASLPRTTRAVKVPAPPASSGSSTPRPRSQRVLEEFKPSLDLPEGEVLDPATTDPKLHLELLARLQQIRPQEGRRSIFDLAPPPAKPAASKPTTVIPSPLTPAPKPGENAAAPAAKPPPPPIQLKYYGFVAANNQAEKRAFFLDGDEIYIVKEGDIIKRRYKVVSVGPSSVLVEDLETKHQQRLILEEQPG